MQEQQQQIELTIIMRKDGSIQVTGPIGNKALSYGLLELARDVIREYDPAKAPPSIIPVHQPFPNGGGA
jgi:hypothetical protein